MVVQHSPPVSPAEPAPPPTPAMDWLGRAAAALGLLYLFLALGGNMYYRIEPARLTPTFGTVLEVAAVAVLVTGVPVLMRRRVVLLLAALLAGWMSSGALSAWALTGDVYTPSLTWALYLTALFVGVAVTWSRWAGWSILLLGTVHIAANLAVYWKSYYSLGTSFPGTTLWWSRSKGWLVDSLTSVEDWGGVYFFQPLPYPDGVIDRARVLVTEVPHLIGFNFSGLSVNANYTGNYIAPFVVFAVAFLTRPLWGRVSTLGRVTRAVAAAAILGPGLTALQILDARTAMVAVLAGVTVLVVPAAWSQNATAASLAAIILPTALVLAPVSTMVGYSYSGRDCVWRSWWTVVRESVLWGAGPPGVLPSLCRDLPHVNAHNELLQAWNVGGLVGLGLATGFIMLVTWQAVRHSDRDGRVLVAVTACCATLLGLEVLSTDWALGWLITIVAYAIGVIHPPAVETLLPVGQNVPADRLPGTSPPSDRGAV